MRILTIMMMLLFIYGCENVRHKVGLTTKPFAKDDGFESSTKFSYSIIFGKVRSKKVEEDDD